MTISLKYYMLRCHLTYITKTPTKYIINSINLNWDYSFIILSKCKNKIYPDDVYRLTFLKVVNLQICTTSHILNTTFFRLTFKYAKARILDLAWEGNPSSVWITALPHAGNSSHEGGTSRRGKKKIVWTETKK